MVVHVPAVEKQPLNFFVLIMSMAAVVNIVNPLVLATTSINGSLIKDFQVVFESYAITVIWLMVAMDIVLISCHADINAARNLASRAAVKRPDLVAPRGGQYAFSW